VSELIDGLLRLMDSREDLAAPVNLGNPSEFTMLELATTVLRMTGSSSRLEFQPLPPDDPRQRQPDISLAMRELGWSPGILLEEGLISTIAYFQRVIDAA
jgi:UDP-glucuronate decarboxylase